MGEYRHNFKVIANGRGPSPLNPLECGIFHKNRQTSCKSLIEWQGRTNHSGKTPRGFLMSYSSPTQRCFPPVSGQTVRADFEGGALSSDFGALLLRGVDRQIGLTARLAAAIHDKRHSSYIDHPLRDLLAQRIYQMASGYADGNDANSLRHDPLFKLGVERRPLAPEHA